MDVSARPSEPLASAKWPRKQRVSTVSQLAETSNALILWREMAHLDEDSSNTLFESLSDWERHLASIDPKGLGCDDGPDFKP